MGDPPPGAALMADYRVYSLDGDGRIGLAEWIQAESDEQAIAAASAMRLGALECEIWQKNRLVATIRGRA